MFYVCKNRHPGPVVKKPLEHGTKRIENWQVCQCADGPMVQANVWLDTGPIDLIWGDENYGVRHILVKHINQKDFPTVNQMIERITSMIQDGTISYENAEKVVLKKDGYLAIIRKNYRIDGKKPAPRPSSLPACLCWSSAAPSLSSPTRWMAVPMSSK